MKRFGATAGIGAKLNRTVGYPLWSMLAIVLLIMVAPFISLYLCFIAFGLCVYRIIRYDAKVFAADYCILLPFSQIFCTTGGMSFLIFLCLIAAVWYLIFGSIRANSVLIWFLLLLNYLILRMQLNISNFLLCFSQIFLLFVLLPKQNAQSALCAARFFCISLLLSSVYALIFRDASQLRAVIGMEATAIWGTNITRFRGLNMDPNYYMTMLVVALALLLRLRSGGFVGKLPFFAGMVIFSAFGVLTYSKTFFVVMLLLLGIYILWQFTKRRFIWGCVLTVITLVTAEILLFADFSPLAVVLSRFAAASNLDDLTTGRTEVFAVYFKTILDGPGNFFFGVGLAADGLFKDPHNLFLEILYYIGTVGLVLYIGFYAALVRSIKKELKKGEGQSFLDRYIVFFMVLLLFFALHGMFQLITTGILMISLLAMKITALPTADVGLREDEI